MQRVALAAATVIRLLFRAGGYAIGSRERFTMRSRPDALSGSPEPERVFQRAQEARYSLNTALCTPSALLHLARSLVYTEVCYLKLSLFCSELDFKARFNEPGGFGFEPKRKAPRFERSAVQVQRGG